MTVKFSVIMGACNAGPMLKETVEDIDQSCRDRSDYEIIVVNDQSQDGCCNDLPSHVRLYDTPERLGCSGSRHYGGERALGDVIIISDPHCLFPPGILYDLADRALATDAIVQPLVIVEGHSRRPYAGITMTDRALTTIVIRRSPKHHVMAGSIYCFNRTVWDKIGCYSPLPGWWDCDENYYSSMAYRMGMWVHTTDDLPTCTHRKYRKTGRLPFSLPDDHRNRNAHWFHAVCFPDTYASKFKEMLDKSAPVDMTGDFNSDRFKQISEHVCSLANHREQWFMENVVI